MIREQHPFDLKRRLLYLFTGQIYMKGGWISSSTPDSPGLVFVDRSTGLEFDEPEVSVESFKRKLGTYRGLARLNCLEDIKRDLLEIVPQDWEPDYLKDSSIKSPESVETITQNPPLPRRKEFRYHRHDQCLHLNRIGIEPYVSRCKDCGEVI